MELNDDRRLVLIIQGDDTSAHLYFWLDTPCAEHGSHTVTKMNADVPPSAAGDPWTWARTMVEASLADLCSCDLQEAPADAVARILAATRA